MSWTDKSREWLQEQINANPHMSLQELRKHCSKNYPFSMRRGWAYKAWCKAMREYFNPQQRKPVDGPSIQEQLEKIGQQRLID